MTTKELVLARSFISQLNEDYRKGTITCKWQDDRKTFEVFLESLGGSTKCQIYCTMMCGNAWGYGYPETVSKIHKAVHELWQTPEPKEIEWKMDKGLEITC